MSVLKVLVAGICFLFSVLNAGGVKKFVKPVGIALSTAGAVGSGLAAVRLHTLKKELRRTRSEADQAQIKNKIIFWQKLLKPAVAVGASGLALTVGGGYLNKGKNRQPETHIGGSVTDDVGAAAGVVDEVMRHEKLTCAVPEGSPDDIVTPAVSDGTITKTLDVQDGNFPVHTPQYIVNPEFFPLIKAGSPSSGLPPAILREIIKTSHLAAQQQAEKTMGSYGPVLLLEDRQPETHIGGSVTDDVGAAAGVVRGDRPVSHKKFCFSQSARMPFRVPPATELPDLSLYASSYGNKTMNLERLRLMTSEWEYVQKATGYTVSIPSFVGISSEAVINFLKNHVSFDAERSYSEDPLSFGLHLNRTWSLHTPLHDATGERLFGVDGKNLDRLLAQACTEGFKLMVRSTGAEDSAELSNAGGNDSFANIEPTIPAVLDAMRKVVLSYFSEKSLAQRAVGDFIVHSRPLFVPVLIQKMIGESDDSIPTAGVLFTQDPASGEPDLKHKNLSGITTIDCCIGNNKLTVESLGPVDRIMVDNGMVIRRIVPVKPLRLKPGRDDLVWAPNSEQWSVFSMLPISHAPVFTDETIKVLKRIAVLIEQSYNRPMDVEFVVLDKEISLVQARPVEKPIKENKPSYIDLSLLATDEKQVKGICIGVGGGAARLLDSKDKYLIANTAAEALSKYLALDSDPKKQALIEAVITKELAAANSHEATQFRRFGVVLLCMQDNYQEAKHLLAQPCVVDAQQQLLLRINVEQIEEVKKTGWISYPAPKMMAVPAVVMSDAERESFVERINKLVELEDSEAYMSNEKPFRELRLLVKQLQHKENVTANLKRIWQICTQDTIFKHYGDRYTNCLAQLGRSVKTLWSYQDIDKDSAEYLQKWLYEIHFMEIILFQQSVGDKCLQADSFFMLWNDRTREKASYKLLTASSIEGARAAADEVLVALNMLSANAFRGETKQAWQQFIKDNFSIIEQRGEQAQQKFGDHIRLLSQLELLPLWLNTSFAKVGNNLDALNVELDSAKDLLIKLAGKKQEINAVPLSAFSDPKKFVKPWKDFQSGLLSYFTSDAFRDDFAAAEGIGKVACIESMRLFVEKFDTAIKACTGGGIFKVNPDGSFNEHAAEVYANEEMRYKHIETGDLNFTFNVMLQEYHHLVYEWHSWSSFYPQIFPSFATARFKRDPVDIHFLKPIFSSCFKRNSDPVLLVPSDIDFEMIALGSGCDSRILSQNIQSLESIFIFIHKGLCNIINAINISVEAVEICLPEELSIIIEDAPKKPTFVMLSLNTVVLAYQVPCKNHNALIKLIYDVYKKRCFCEIRIFGCERNLRFYSGARSLYDYFADYEPEVSVYKDGIKACFVMVSNLKLSKIYLNVTFVLCELDSAHRADPVTKNFIILHALADRNIFLYGFFESIQHLKNVSGMSERVHLSLEKYKNYLEALGEESEPHSGVKASLRLAQVNELLG